MKQYFSKKFQKARMHFENVRSKVVTRVWNLAARLDQSHSRNETKKKKQQN